MAKGDSHGSRSGRGTIIAIGCVIACAAAALGTWALQRPATSTAGPPTINVVIILIDTLRADRLGCYGYSKPTSPNIDALARESVVFEDASTPAPWTLPTVPSLMTGVLPCEHQVLVDGNILDSRRATLAERLESQGYQAYSFYHNPYAGPVTGLQRGFDISVLTTRTGNTGGAFLDSFFSDKPERPVFLYIHNTEPHNPYEARDEYIRLFGEVSAEVRKEFKRNSDEFRRLTRMDFDNRRAVGTTDNTEQQLAALARLDAIRPQVDILYDATVREADDRVGEIIATLKSRGLWDDTLLILTADHGEEMGEHGGWQHDQALYQELAHVPLIIRFPAAKHGGARVAQPVGLIDVVPTVGDVLARPAIAEGARGRSLVPLARGEKWADGNAPVVYSVRWNKKKFTKPWKETRGDYQIAVRQQKWKLIYSVEIGKIELYDLGTDPGEKTNVADAQPAVAAALRQFAERFVAECGERAAKSGGTQRGKLDPESQKRLMRMGYVGGADDESDEPTTQPTTSPNSKPGN